MSRPPSSTPHGGLQVDIAVGERLRAVFEVAPGGTLAVIGPNGSGKTTLLHALAGLIPAHGHALLAGLELLTLQVQSRRTGVVFQGQVLFPHLSARDNVAFGLRSRGLARRQALALADSWLERLEVADLADRRPGELSGGQAQRVAIARALVTEPRLLLLDEPFTGLDVSVAMALRIELARHLADYPGITLLVTHDPVDALTLADHVLVLQDGRVAQAGPAAEVAARPQTDHVARLVGLNLVETDRGLVAFRPDAVSVSLDQPTGSPRLRWRGEIVSLTPHGDAVRLLVCAEPDLLVDVTPGAATELGLVPGQDVWLSVKATTVTRYGPVSSGR